MNILKENATTSTVPPTELSISTKATEGIQQNILMNGEKGFIHAYTRKDIFEQLQKKMTNSYSLAQKASLDEEL